MVTGVETAGVVLGSIPLILASLEFYAKGIAVTKRYFRYREEFKTLTTEVRTENTIFRNSIELILAGVVRQNEMANFLASPGGERWKEKGFERKLKRRLGSSYDSYIDTITQMSTAAEVFKERLQLASSGKPQFTDVDSFKEHYKRLRFSLNKTDYRDLMAKLRHANSSLQLLSNQTMSLHGLHGRCKPVRESIPNFKAINVQAQRFYSALQSGWKCACHKDHSVSLQLEPRMEDVPSDEDEDDGEATMRHPFHVLFCYSENHQKRPKSSRDIAPWSWDEADVRITFESQEVRPPEASLTKKKAVRFASQAKHAVAASLGPDSHLQPIRDLCEAISTLQKPQRGVCLELLVTEFAKREYGLRIYPLKEAPSNPEAWSVSSLRSVLQDKRFTRHDRLRLAVILASTVLQLHETPWLQDNWNKDNILFIQRSDMIKYDQPFVSQSFNQAIQPGSNIMPDLMVGIIRNQTLYALGVSLIELWYRNTLHELHQPKDGLLDTGDTCNDLMTEWRTADRLVEELYDDAGAKYADAVRRCIRCDFDRRASNLADLSFQRAVYHGVVSQLKENLDFLYQSMSSQPSH